MKKRIIATIVAFTMLTLSAWAQGTAITTYMAVGPENGEPAYNNFLSSMLLGMRQGDSLAPTPISFIPNGNSVNTGSIISYDDNTGAKLFAGFSAISPSLFSIGQMSRELWTSFHTSSNLFSNSKFGSTVIGIKWGPNGPGTGDTVYSSGSADTVLVNELYVVANTYTIRASDPSDKDRSISAFHRLNGDSVPVNARYSLGNYFDQGTVNLCVPEPSSIAIIGIAFAGMIMSRRRG